MANDELSEREDRLYAQPDGPNQESFDEQSNNEEDDNVSINDWGAESCAARGVVQSEGEDEPDVIYHGEPCTHHRASLADWSVGNGYPDDETVPVEEFAEELGRWSEDKTWESLVVQFMPEDDYVELSKVSDVNLEMVAYRQRATKDIGPSRMEDSPKRDFKHLGVIEGYMHINGQKAHVLLDGGSTLDMVSANFASVHKLNMFQLKKPVKLQMATSGSRSVINYGAQAKLQVGRFKQSRYFDMVNLDRYHVILGTPFLKEHGVMLNYTGHGSFKLND